MSEYGPEHPRNLIPELCNQFYHLGWVTGTGGGISIKDGEKIYIAPSGVQKERMKSDDLFVQTIDDEDLELPPPAKQLRKSQCTPLFMLAYRERGAGAVIHTHSPHAVRCTLLYDKEFVITHQEMIKGIKDAKLGRYLRYDEKLVVPIIENTPFERDLASSLGEALRQYPGTSVAQIQSWSCSLVLSLAFLQDQDQEQDRVFLARPRPRLTMQDLCKNKTHPARLLRLAART